MSSDLARKLAEALKQEFPGSLIEHDMEWIAALLDRAGLAEAEAMSNRSAELNLTYIAQIQRYRTALERIEMLEPISHEWAQAALRIAREALRDE